MTLLSLSTPIVFLCMILATHRLSILLVYDLGPWRILEKFREYVGVYREEDRGVLADLLSCVYCTSVWVALLLIVFFCILPLATFYFMMPLAVSGGVIILEKIRTTN